MSLVKSEILQDNIFDMRPDILLKYELKKYEKKNKWIILAFIIAFLYFFGFSYLLMTFWPEKINNPGIFYVFTVYVFFISMLISVNIEYLFIYKIANPFFEKYKPNPGPWPWETDYEKWRLQLKKSIYRVFLNNFIILLIMLSPNIFTNNCPLRLDKESFPSYLEMIWQIIFCMFVEDFIFYWSHRLLHSTYFYSKIHKIHHEYVETVTISATYSHPIEYILGNILPSGIAPMILGTNMHFITYLVYLTMVLHESHDGHSGYNFPWSPHRIIPFTFDAEFHIFHHWKYTGNYANYLSIWDRVFKTVNKSYMEYFKNKEKYLQKFYENKKSLNISEIVVENLNPDELSVKEIKKIN